MGVSCLVLKMIALPSPRGLQHEVLWSEQGSWKWCGARGAVRSWGWPRGVSRQGAGGSQGRIFVTRWAGVDPLACTALKSTHLRKTRSTGTGGGTGCQALSWSDLKSRRGKRAESRATGQNLWAWDWRLRFALRKEQESRSEMNPCKRAGGLNRALEAS